MTARPRRDSAPRLDVTPDDRRLPSALGAIDEAALRAAGVCVESCPAMGPLLDESSRRAAGDTILRADIREAIDEVIDVRKEVRALRGEFRSELREVRTDLRRSRWRGALGLGGASLLGTQVLPWALWYLSQITGHPIPPPYVPSGAAQPATVR